MLPLTASTHKHSEASGRQHLMRCRSCDRLLYMVASLPPHHVGLLPLHAVRLKANSSATLSPTRRPCAGALAFRGRRAAGHVRARAAVAGGRPARGVPVLRRRDTVAGRLVRRWPRQAAPAGLPSLAVPPQTRQGKATLAAHFDLSPMVQAQLLVSLRLLNTNCSATHTWLHCCAWPNLSPVDHGCCSEIWHA